jgi:hypothetical protein
MRQTLEIPGLARPGEKKNGQKGKSAISVFAM